MSLVHNVYIVSIYKLSGNKSSMFVTFSDILSFYGALYLRKAPLDVSNISFKYKMQ